MIYFGIDYAAMILRRAVRLAGMAILTELAAVYFMILLLTT